MLALLNLILHTLPTIQYTKVQNLQDFFKITMAISRNTQGRIQVWAESAPAPPF